MNTTRIGVVGAKGYTGRLVAAALAADSAITVVPIGRGQALPALTAIVHCAGPFKWPDPILERAMAARIHVISLAGELDTVGRLLALDAEAKQRGIAIVVAAGFSTAIAELAAWLASKTLATPDTITLTRTAAKSMPSVGSLRSYISEADAPVLAWRDGALVPIPIRPAARYEFAKAGPRAVSDASGPELLTLSRSFGALSVSLRVDVGPEMLAGRASVPPYTRDGNGLAEMLAWRDERGTLGPTDDERAAMSFAVAAEVKDTGGNERSVEIQGADPYGLTALIASELVRAVISNDVRGVLSPVQAVDPQTLLAALARRGLRWQTRGAAKRALDEPSDFIAAALAQGSVPALLASIVHLTGSTEILEGALKPGRAVIGDTSGFFDAEQQAEARRLVTHAIETFRRDGCPVLPPPDDVTLHRMMRFVVGDDVPDEYVPMMREELALTDGDARAPRPGPVGVESKHVIIMGAGMSGILAAIRLSQAGFCFSVLEKNTDLGGTWLDNTYPGCRVDIPNHLYSYSFAQNSEWSEYFSQQKELHAYFTDCAERYGIKRQIRFSTEVLSARFDEQKQRWRVTFKDRTGTHELEADAVISAVGQLNQPRDPELPGLPTFAGPSFHSSRWRHDVSLAGKRVGIIGTGASALQIIPELARSASRLTILQRSPPWVFANPAYRQKTGAGEKWLMRHIPGYARWYRFLLFWPSSDAMMKALVVDPTWPHRKRSVSSRNDDIRVLATAWIEQQLAGRPDLIEKALPKYPPFAKRMLQDDGSYLQALRQPNVELINDAIERVIPTGVIVKNARHIDLDALVYCTGFQANHFLWPMAITGRGGAVLSQVWGDEPRAYLGMTVPEFPNFFCLYGPGTSLAHAGSIIFQAECQVRYVVSALQALVKLGGRSLEVKREVYDRYNQKFAAAAAQMAFADPAVDNWYKNSAGVVVTTSPFRLVDYWRWTKEPNLEEFTLRA